MIGNSIVCTTAFRQAMQKQQSYVLLAICGGTHQRHVDSPRRDGNVESVSTPWCHRAISNTCYSAFHDMDTRKRYLCWFLIAICTVALSLNHLWQSPGYLGYLTKSLHAIEPLHFKAFPTCKWYMMGHREFYDKHDFIPYHLRLDSSTFITGMCALWACSLGKQHLMQINIHRDKFNHKD